MENLTQALIDRGKSVNKQNPIYLGNYKSEKEFPSKRPDKSPLLINDFIVCKDYKYYYNGKDFIKGEYCGVSVSKKEFEELKTIVESIKPYNDEHLVEENSKLNKIVNSISSEVDGIKSGLEIYKAQNSNQHDKFTDSIIQIKNSLDEIKESISAHNVAIGRISDQIISINNKIKELDGRIPPEQKAVKPVVYKLVHKGTGYEFERVLYLEVSLSNEPLEFDCNNDVKVILADTEVPMRKVDNHFKSKTKFTLKKSIIRVEVK